MIDSGVDQNTGHDPCVPLLNYLTWIFLAVKGDNHVLTWLKMRQLILRQSFSIKPICLNARRGAFPTAIPTA